MNVPKLRFKEFTAEYRNVKFDDIVNYQKGFAFKSNDYKNNGIRIIRISDTTNNSIKKDNPIYISKSEASKYKNVELLTNDIIISSVGSKPPLYDSMVGKVVLVPEFENGSLLNQNAIRFRAKYDNQIYIYNYLKQKKYTKFIENIMRGNANQRSITLEDLLNFKLSIPSLKEQTKVANLLSLLEKKIELQTQKIEVLKLFTKKIILDTLNKENNFESKYFKEVCTIQTGKSNTQDKDDNGIYPFYIRSENIEHSKKYIFDCEAVITIGDGKIGKIFFYENGKFDCHQRVYVLNNFKEVTGKYLYYYFSTFFYRRAISMSAKNTVDSVRMEMISNMSIKIPSIEEQERITKIFDNLELKKKLETSKLEKLNYLKKGLLQNMFV